MDNIKLLQPSDEQDAEISWEDQSKINKFSKLNAKLEVLQDKYEAEKKEKEYLDDLEMELELQDEDSALNYKIGDAFVKLSYLEAMERVEADKKEAETKLEEMKDELDSISEVLDTLKAELYAKFGKAINLDKD